MRSCSQFSLELSAEGHVSIGIYKAYQLGKYPNITIVLHGDQSIQGTGHETEFLKELDDKTTSYAILSHRWGNEVSYKEIIGLTRTRKKQEGNN